MNYLVIKVTIDWFPFKLFKKVLSNIKYLLKYNLKLYLIKYKKLLFIEKRRRRKRKNLLKIF